MTIEDNIDLFSVRFQYKAEMYTCITDILISLVLLYTVI